MNIEEYEFYDDDVSFCHSTDGEVYFNLALDCATLMIAKRDVIALCQHFKLTADDIKGKE